MYQLNEDKRQQLINKSKYADSYIDQRKGKNRYQRRLHSKLLDSVNEFNSMDMNNLFKNNILTVNVSVQGETDKYTVQIKFGGVLDQIHDQLKRNSQKFDLKVVLRSLIVAFNSDDVYIHCSCADWQFRQSYWSRINDVSSDASIEQPDNGRRIVNPNDTKGRGCKHVLLTLSNNKWLRAVASVIFNYTNHMEKNYPRLYADVIYPAIYEKKYDDNVQLDIDSVEETEPKLPSSEDELDTSNKWAKTRGQFKTGNEYRFTPNDKEIPGQKSFDFDSLISNN